MLVLGQQSLPSDDSCPGDVEYWYERTAYRKIPHSTCEGGPRPDRGTRRTCPGIRSKGATFWLFTLMVPFAFTALIGYWYYRRSGMAKGCVALCSSMVRGRADERHRRTIRLPGDPRPTMYRMADSGALATLASVPWFIVGVVGIAWEATTSWVQSTAMDLRLRRGYRNVPVDEDAQILHFEDEEYQ